MILDGIEKQFVGQLIALVAFFLFPCIQYILLKISSRKDGTPELWYLPKYGFRLVIRNIPRNKTLSNIRQTTFLRKVIPPSHGTSVATYEETILVTQEELFLFPGNDQILICFRIEGTDVESLEFIVCDKLGNEKERHAFSSFDRLISNYTGKMENLFNFDVQIAKQTQLYVSDMKEIWVQVCKKNVENLYKLSKIKSVG